VIGFLRLLGIFNAALWLGAALFFTFGVGPVFFQPDVKKVAGEAQAGIIAMLVLERYFLLHIVCATIAILQQLAEWVYFGRTLHRLTLILLACLAGFGLLAEFGLHPRMQRLHETKYAYLKTPQGYARNDAVTPPQRARAATSFRIWHGVSQAANLLVLAGIAVHLWRVTHRADETRFLSAQQFRS
jgi:hypothetical protein